jgi:hypothetical protein
MHRVGTDWAPDATYYRYTTALPPHTPTLHPTPCTVGTTGYPTPDPMLALAAAIHRLAAAIEKQNELAGR